jgi:hypothetical protein
VLLADLLFSLLAGGSNPRPLFFSGSEPFISAPPSAGAGYAPLF